ncbi:MAG TPA: DUF2085 domain-containing protein [Methanobacterium sp.]|nr:DUF2085 domain-containing protein [Methanobacterium sp.]
MILGLIILIPAFIDGFTQLINLRLSKNSLRFFTGIRRNRTGYIN